MASPQLILSETIDDCFTKQEAAECHVPHQQWHIFRYPKNLRKESGEICYSHGTGASTSFIFKANDREKMERIWKVIKNYTISPSTIEDGRWVAYED